VTRVGIHIGDDTILLFLEVPRDVLERGFQSLAVSTLRGSKSDENVLVVV